MGMFLRSLNQHLIYAVCYQFEREHVMKLLLHSKEEL